MGSIMKQHWQPPDFKRPDAGRLGRIKSLFTELFPGSEYGDLAESIGRGWINRLERTWQDKSDAVKAKDLHYDPADPLSRVAPKTVVIAYADSVREKGRPTLATLEHFLETHFPAVGGLHILPPCEMAADRFNDGGFSQIRRNRIHPSFGTNSLFEALMEKYFSMTDFVLNHVDIDHPRFRQYLEGDDRAGECFFVFSEAEYRNRAARGDFDAIFRPRPFPLFTIFRRSPKPPFHCLARDERLADLNERFRSRELQPLPDAVLNLLTIFGKIRNDQMLLENDYRHLTRFRSFVSTVAGLHPDNLFVISDTQETRHTPYIFHPDIDAPEHLLAPILPGLGLPAEKAGSYADVFADSDTELFGEPVRALTTFSHVQVDLNTATFEGLKLLADDFSWYLKMDLNMLRLDAANFAFKRWNTSCFGLPEVGKLLNILYLSMDCVSPRIVPNLEVNAPLSAVLRQMAEKAPPPMMYDFHLPCMLPVVFNTADARPLTGIAQMVQRQDIPESSIRFSLDESHDGKSVSGSGGADGLLTFAHRRSLSNAVLENGGHVKFKSTPRHRFPAVEFDAVCGESGLDPVSASDALFDGPPNENGMNSLKPGIRDRASIARALHVDADRLDTDAALAFFLEKILDGKEPYELCTTTRDVLRVLEDPVLEVKRYLAFKTLALSLMGRNVKATFFNDLVGLKNDAGLVEKTGELRNIKRTRSECRELENRIGDPANAEHWIARYLNNLIALVDADPAFGPRGEEAYAISSDEHPAVALVHATCRNHHSLVVVNTGSETETVRVRRSDYGFEGQAPLLDNLTGTPIENGRGGGDLLFQLNPFGRFWIKRSRVEIAEKRLQAVGSEAQMAASLAL